MKIDKTSLNLINFNEGIKTKSVENGTCLNKRNINAIKTPSDPSYWQSLTFNGTKKLSNMSEQEKDCIVEEYSKIKQSFPKEYFRESLHYFVNDKTGKISKIGLDAISRMYFARFFTEEKSGNEIILRAFSPWYKFEIKELLPKLVNAMKDKAGAFNKKNCDTLEDILKMQEAPLFLKSENLENFGLLKNDKGVIDTKKFNAVKSLIRRLYSLSADDVKKYIKFINAAGVDKENEILSKLEKLTGSKHNAVVCSESYYKNCYDKNGNKVQEKVDFIDKIAKLYNNKTKIDERVYEFLNLRGGADLLFEIAENKNELTPADVYCLLDLVKTNGYEDGSISEGLKEKFFSNFDEDMESCDYIKIFSMFTNGRGNNARVNENKLKFACALYKNCEKVSLSEISFDELKDCVNGSSKIEGMEFAKKMTIIEALSLMLSSNETKKRDLKHLNNLISRIEASICMKDFIMPVSKENIREFQNSILKSNPENAELTNFERVITKSIPRLKEMKKGLKISYSREQFLSDLTKLCNTEEKKELLSSKTEIELIEENGEIKGYNGLIILNKLNRKNEFESKIYELCNKFIYENRVKTEDKELDAELNKIIKAVPEFVNVIGKKQHNTQAYTLDIHQLLALAYSINDPNYKKLNKNNKMVLKLSALLHDISKKENAIDAGHQNSSAVYTQNIISKYVNNLEIKDRIFDFVKNHHWLAEYNNADDKKEKAQQLAFKFRRTNDFEAAKIFAKSDLMAVSDEFYNAHKDALNNSSLKRIDVALNMLYSTGSAVFSDYPVDKNKLENHKEVYNNREFKVINFHKIKNETDMSKYGFDKGKTKNKLYLLVHMLPEDDIKKYINIFRLLSYSSNEGALSESLITLDKSETYASRKYGLLLSEANINIINLSDANQTSGGNKSTSNAIDLIFNPKDSARANFKIGLLNALGIYYYDVSDDEYAKFYKENIANITSLSQIDENKIYSMGRNSFSGAELKNAIEKYQKENLIPKGQDSHNEIVGYAPKIEGVIAKEKSLKDLPAELLDFAYENDLPIVLI